MTELSDQQLLVRFRADHDREALDALARRYLGLVYSAALRQVRDPHLAEDITQAVFIVLVRSARTIRADAVLPAWLFTVTRHAAANALRMRNRRRFHESRKMNEKPETAPTDDLGSSELREHLDEAIARLPAPERSGVLLHFFAHCTHKQIGDALGMSEEAARKRVSRGLEKMRTILHGRGVTATGIALIASALATESASAAAVAPAGLLGSTVNVAMLAGTVVPSGASAPAIIAQGVTRMLAISKIKVATAVAAAVLFAGGVASPLVMHALRAAGPAPVSGIVSTIIQSNVPATKPAGPARFAVDVGDNTHVDFLGVSIYPAENDTWSALDGEPIDCPDDRALQGKILTQPLPEFCVAARVKRPASTVLRMRVPNSTTSAVIQNSDGEETVLMCAFSSDNGAKTAKVELGISEGAWNTVAGNENPKDEIQSDVPSLGAVTFHPIEEDDSVATAGGGSKVSVDFPATDLPSQIVMVDAEGKEHETTNINMRTDGQSVTLTCTFDVAPDKAHKILFQTRPFSKFVDVSDISLEKGTITHPEIKVRSAKDSK